MTPQHHLPADIERTSMSIITEPSVGWRSRRRMRRSSSGSSILRPISTTRKTCTLPPLRWQQALPPCTRA